MVEPLAQLAAEAVSSADGGMKTLFINIHYLELGGAEMSLLGLLHALDPKEVEVDLLVNDPRGPLMKFIPKWVNLLDSPTPYRMVERPMAEALRHGCLRVVAGRLLARRDYQRYVVHKGVTGESNAIFTFLDRRVVPGLPGLKLNKTYDVALAFCGFPSVVLQKVNARRKLAWIHTDYTAIDVNKEAEMATLSGFDNVVCVSSEAREQFLRVMPELAAKTMVIENCLPVGYIRDRAQISAAEPLNTEERLTRYSLRGKTGGTVHGLTQEERLTRVSLLTIGRYCAAKRLDAIPGICRRLAERGIDVTWRIIGYGGDDSYIRDAIAAEGMEERVLPLGKQENPYPWIAACDWYVQPSLYEGKSITVREAQVLGKPVIITAYPTAKAQLREGVDGLIVPMDVDACAEAMAAAIMDDGLRQRLIANVQATDYSMAEEARKIFCAAKPAQPYAG